MFWRLPCPENPQNQDCVVSGGVLVLDDALKPGGRVLEKYRTIGLLEEPDVTQAGFRIARGQLSGFWSV